MDLGTGTLPFQRIDGVAESFHTEQNRELLEKLASETGGRYWKPDELTRLPNEISVLRRRDFGARHKELWNMPVVFLLLLLLMVGGMAAAPQVGCGMRPRLLLCGTDGRAAPRMPASITSRWRAWAASRITSSDLRRMRRTWTSCSRHPAATRMFTR